VAALGDAHNCNETLKYFAHSPLLFSEQEYRESRNLRSLKSLRITRQGRRLSLLLLNRSNIRYHQGHTPISFESSRKWFNVALFCAVLTSMPHYQKCNETVFLRPRPRLR
jgi:hypothetical protein